MQRVPSEVRDFIARRCRESPRSRFSDTAYGGAVRLVVRSGHIHLLRPVIRGPAIRRLLHDLARGLDTRSGDGYSLHVVLARSPAAFSTYCRRNPAWVAAQIAAATTQPNT